MPMKLYVIHGSHPCAAVEKALGLKGLPYRRVELIPPLHAVIQRVIFGQRTVPGLRLADGDKVVGSRAIMRRLEALAPEPALIPSDPATRARVEEAERWGDEVFQPVPRRILWPAVQRRPDAFVSYAEHSSLPLTASVIRLSAPLIARVERSLNQASDEAARGALAGLPGDLDRVDAWIADGLLGGDPPTVADLQVASTIALLMTIGDVRPLIEGRPAQALATRLFPRYDGDTPAGAIPADWLPARNGA